MIRDFSAYEVSAQHRARILGGINQSAENIYRQELEREQQRSKELATAFTAQKKLSTRLKRTSYVLAAVAIVATAMALLAYRLQLFAESRALAAQAERELTNDRHKALASAIKGIERATTSESAEAV